MTNRPKILDISFSDIIIILISFLTSAAILLPLKSLPLGVDIDRSWAYAIADAAQRHIPFGKDVVFTFGPLSSIYSGLFLPDQMWAVFIYRLTLLSVVFYCLIKVTPRSLRWLTIIFPLLLANIFVTDAFYFLVSWIIVPLAFSERESNSPGRSAFPVALITGLLAPLVLVKGSLTVPLTASVFVSSAILWRNNRIAAACLPVIFVFTIIFGWEIVGQQLIDLPYYFKRQYYVINGYTNAMSLVGDRNEIIIYIVGAGLMIGAQWRNSKEGILVFTSLCVVLFVAFKAGFVRHDAHAMIAASTMLLVGYFILMQHWCRRTIMGFCVAMTSWLYIGHHYIAIDLSSDFTRLQASVERFIGDAHTAFTQDHYLLEEFNEQKNQITKSYALPPTQGKVDLYPNLVALPLASGRDYYPRPAVQSYTAYTPELAFLDAEHLNSSQAPDTVFFSISPLDQRYPSLEDGPSWPALLGQYRFRLIDHGMAVLDRVPGSSAVPIEKPMMERTISFGETVDLPDDAQFVWAKMQFRPTILGRLASAMFKLPLIKIEVTTADDVTKEYRLIPGMTSAGFLISPIVLDSNDFVALRAANQEAMAQRKVKHIRVTQAGLSNLWSDMIEIQLSPLAVRSDPSVDEAAVGITEEGPAVNTLPNAGDCNIDSVAGRNLSASLTKVPWKTAIVNGWGYISASQGIDGGNLRIAITPEGGKTKYVNADRFLRADVDAHFHLTHPTVSGFTARVNLSEMEGRAKIQVVEEGPKGMFACGAPAVLER